MAWYDTGTISVTNGSSAVTGSSTQWITGAQVGEAMLIAGELYEISAINSATSITLGKNYLGSTQSGLSYEIVPTQSLVADLASDVTDLISDYATIANNAGAGKFNDGTETSPGITFNQDQDNGFYRSGSNTWVATVGGSDTVEFNSTGIDVTGTLSSDGLAVDTNTLVVDAVNNRVGIGTPTPSTSLDVNSGTDNTVATFESTDSIAVVKFKDNSTSNYIATGANGDDFVFYNGSEAARIDQNGNLLVGTTSSIGLGDTSGNGVHAYGNGMNIKRECTSSTQGLLHLNNIGTAGNVVEFYQDGVERGKITVSSSATAYNTSSDYRLKEDWQPIENATDRLLQLNPCNFAWKADGSRVDGFLAHEAQEVVPEAVTGEKDAMRTEEYEAEPAVYEGDVLVSEAVMAEREVPDYQAIDQSKLVPLLVATIQELEARIQALEDAQ
jgi:hypothetical protein